MIRLTPNVYVEIVKNGCNTGFVVTSEGVFAHDTPMLPEAAKNWAAEIAKHGTLRYVVNGEYHPDHILGNCYLGGTLIAHEGTREEILKKGLNDYKDMVSKHMPGSRPDKDFYYRAPDITLNNRLTIYLGKHTFKLMALPGHTACQVCTFVPEEGVVFTSDTVGTSLPVMDESLPDEWIESLKFLQTLDFDKIVCGHGEVQEKSYISHMIKHIRTWLDVVADAIKKGMTLEEAQKNITMEKEFPDLIKDTAHKPDIIPTNVARIYIYLKNKKSWHAP